MALELFPVRRVLKKEFLQLRRDRRIFPIIFIAPVLQLVFLGYAATLDFKHIPLAVWDQDHSPESRGLVQEVTSSLYFDLAATVSSYPEIERLLKRSEISAALVIPPGFSRGLKKGRPSAVQAVIDAADANQARVIKNYLEIIIQTKAARLMTAELGRKAPLIAESAQGLLPEMDRLLAEKSLIIQPEPRVWFNPELRSANFMVPGVVVTVLLVITMMLTALAVVREKETGTMEQVIVTPIKPWQFILGKLLPFTIIGFIEVTIVAGIAVAWFKVPFRAGLPALYGYSALFLLSTLGFGLFLSTISHNQQQAMMTAFFIIFTMILLSGFMFPIENMPRPVQVLTYLIPMRYFLVIVRALFLKGSGLAALWPQALGLLLLGSALVAVSVARFRKTID